ncbi:MAG: Fe-S-cluster containining protein [Oleiphilaceae bacterium]|jgi:Fe-S-cluster containining protein
MKDCNQCGKCCIKYSNGGLTASKSEMELWEIFRPHIAEYVRDGKLWMDPATGKQIELCPWLRKAPNQEIYTCDIYFDRPEDCRHYPTTIEEMVNDECEMIEVQDLADPKKAQTSLDKLMADSRPPLD